MAGEKDVTLFYSEVRFKKIRVFILSTEVGLAATSIAFEYRNDPAPFLKGLPPGSRLIEDRMKNKQAQEAVAALLRGEIPPSMPELDIRMTDFQWQVMKALSRIPYGQTRTYGELALSLGRPKAARAVGGALSRNPLPVIFPCHRVVATNGLGGFGPGLDIKAYLLDLESRSSSAEENL
jgi:O-6-methylguanine DNA methyltransferase